MRIGIVGSQYTVQKVCSMVNKENMFVELVEYPGIEDPELVDMLDEIQRNVDGVIFTGGRVYTVVTRYGHATVPWACLERLPDTISYALIRAMQEGRDISRITYDVFNLSSEKMLNLLRHKACLKVEKLEVFSYNETKTYSDYFASKPLESIYARDASEFHIDKLRSGRASICITGSPSVFRKVQEKGYPVYLQEISEDMVNATFNELRLRCQMKQEKSQNLCAVLSVNIQMSDKFDEESQRHQQIHTFYQIESSAQTFAQSINAALEKQSDTHFLIYSNKEELDTATNKLAKLAFVEPILQNRDVKRVTAGIGFGASPGVARSAAMKAGRIADKQKNSCYYIIDEANASAGPFVIAQDRDNKKDFAQAMLEHIAAETNVGVAILSKLTKAQMQYGFTSITSEELAKMCGMTINNMNRIVVKLEKAGYAEITGSRSFSDRGRPRRLIRLRFGAYM